jgi:ribonuclease HI
VTEPLIFIYADESCLGNQFKDRARPGGAGGLLEHHHPSQGWVRRDYWVAEPDTTNNRMALVSAADLLGLLKAESRVVFTSDSRYLIDGMTQWVHGWASRGWKRKDGEIENLALWRALVEAARRHTVQWCWVKGHAGHAQNEYANFLATRAAAEQTRSGGLIPSSFDAWVEKEQAAGRCRAYAPRPADAHAFVASRRPPAGG